MCRNSCERVQTNLDWGFTQGKKDDSCFLEILEWLQFVELLEIWIIGNYFFQKWTLPLLPCFQFDTPWCVMAPLVPWFFFCSCSLSESIWQQDTNHLKQSVSALSLFWSIKSCKYQINTMFPFSCILGSGLVSQSVVYTLLFIVWFCPSPWIFFCWRYFKCQRFSPFWRTNLFLVECKFWGLLVCML